MRTLDQMVDGMHAHARRTLIGSATEQILPFFHVQFRDGEDAIIPTPWRDEREKSAFIKAVRMSLKLFRGSVVNYAVISEAWFAEYDHEPRAGMVMPADRETKKEVVIVSAGDKDRATMKVWEITRDDKGAVTDLVEEKGAPKDWEGRMYDLLGDEE